MGRRGPPPKAPWLNALEGNPGKRARRDNVPSPKRSAPTCPEWLGAEAKAEWRRLAPRLIAMGLLTTLDRAAFVCYCTAYGHWKECQRVIRQHGEVYVTGSGRIKERPEVVMARQWVRLMKDFAVEFGLTPSSRARLSLPPDVADPDGEGDEFSRWLEKRRGFRLD